MNEKNDALRLGKSFPTIDSDQIQKLIRVCIECPQLKRRNRSSASKAKVVM